MSMRITRKPWFGPKRGLGWGWTPVSWEGWTATGVFAALVIAANAVWAGHGNRALVATLVLVAALIVLAAITGDPPGGGRGRA